MTGEFNRAAQLWRNWEEKQQMLKEVFGGDLLTADLSRQQYDFLTHGMHRITRPTADEKMVLELIAKATGKLEKQLYPNPLVRLLVKVKELVFDRPVQAARQQKLLAGNVADLDNTLSRMGLGTDQVDLAPKLDYQRPSIGIDVVSAYGLNRNLVEVSLNLEKDAAGRYQLESYSASLKDASGISPDRSYRFPATLEVNVKEALNLLEGRAVFKPGAGRDAGHWLQLDFKSLDRRGGPLLKSFDQSGGFDLKRELASLAGTLNRGELSGNEILKALEAGKQVAVKLVLGAPVFLEADPGKGRVLLRNEKQVPVSLAKLKENNVQQKQELEKSLAPVRQLNLNKEKNKDKEHSLGISQGG